LLKLRGRPEVDYISMQDSAVLNTDPWGKYIQSGFKRDVIEHALDPSVQPTVFKLRALSRAQCVALDVKTADVDRTAKQDDEIIAYGLRGIIGMPGVDCKLTGSADRERVDEATMNLVFDRPDLRRELATIIVRLSSLVPLDV
jgi:hypothetical protein